MPDDAQAFEVASVKLQKADDAKSFSQIQPTGRVTITNETLRSIIVLAYDIQPTLARFALIGGSEEILAARFDIHAVPPEGVPTERQRALAMLRALLGERFKLRTHTETRQLPIYAMARADSSKLGPSLRRTEHDCMAFQAARSGNRNLEVPRDVDGAPICTRSYEINVPKRGAFKIRWAGSLDILVRRVQAFVDRPLVDATGLTGNFDWVISFSNDPFDPEIPTVFTALEEQLGLKVERRTGPVEVLVIDSVEMPTPN